jgi:hypothetical protein
MKEDIILMYRFVRLNLSGVTLELIFISQANLISVAYTSAKVAQPGKTFPGMARSPQPEKLRQD